MYQFEQHLEPDETILYQGEAVSGKGSKASVICLVFIFIVMIGIQALLIGMKKADYGKNGLDERDIIFWLATLFFQGICICGTVYTLWIKKKSVKGNYYCLTNKRAFCYKAKKNKLVFGYLEKYEKMQVENEKGNYGDIYMSMIDGDEIRDGLPPDVGTVKDLLLHPNPEYMPSLSFLSIENPREVLAIAREARNKRINSKK